MKCLIFSRSSSTNDEDLNNNNIFAAAIAQNERIVVNIQCFLQES